MGQATKSAHPASGKGGGKTGKEAFGGQCYCEEVGHRMSECKRLGMANAAKGKGKSKNRGKGLYHAGAEQDLGDYSTLRLLGR